MSNCLLPVADSIPIPPPHRVILGDPWCVENSSRALCPGEWSVVPCLATRGSTQTCAITKTGSRERCRATDYPLPSCHYQLSLRFHCLLHQTLKSSSALLPHT